MPHRQLRLALALAAAVATGAGGLAPAAGAAVKKTPKAVGRVITVNEGIGALKLGMAPEQARRLLGKPNSTFKTGGEVLRLHYEKKYGLSLLFSAESPNTLLLINIEAPRFRTPGGIKVGSKMTKVQAAYPGAQCGGVSGAEPSEHKTVCIVGREGLFLDGIGKLGTGFNATDGVLTGIDVG